MPDRGPVGASLHEDKTERSASDQGPAVLRLFDSFSHTINAIEVDESSTMRCALPALVLAAACAAAPAPAPVGTSASFCMPGDTTTALACIASMTCYKGAYSFAAGFEENGACFDRTRNGCDATDPTPCRSITSSLEKPTALCPIGQH